MLMKLKQKSPVFVFYRNTADKDFLPAEDLYLLSPLLLSGEQEVLESHLKQ